MVRTTAAALVGLAAALAACGEARGIATGAVVPNCARCHGSADGSSAPPHGAHTTHVRALSGESACVHCHPDPRLGSTAHVNGRTDVVFGALATREGALSPRFDPDTSSCSGVHCHGSFAGGNESNAPVWTSVGQGAGDCGTCHALPPAATHGTVSADLEGCAGCHEGTVDAAGSLIAGGAHLDGRIDYRADACLSCHGGVAGGAATRSSHLAGPTDASGCRTCHEAAPQGHLAVPSVNASCIACHDGQGEALGGQTPPLLVGWTDAVTGDWHGARAGTGYGGTLAAPYARGQGALPCTACHDAHSSANAFLFAAAVNGTAVPVATIDRAGVGAEALCAACHEGERHAGCLACHTADPKPPGSPCFWCHGHEGILHWPPPDGDHGSWTGNCDHCHGFSQPPTEYAAPRITQEPTASGLTATTATVRWRTDEGTTSYVEYGVGVARWVAGDAAFVYEHAVTLTGLAPGTTYVWRVRSSDQFRNVGESALQTFTTPGAEHVPRPDVAPVWAGAEVGTYSVDATLLWYPVTAPSGTLVEYEVQLAEDPSFTTLVNSTLERIDPTLATGNSGWIPGTPTQDSSNPPRPAVGFDVTLTNLPQDWCDGTEPNVYYFRVRARDQAGHVSEWSATGSFTAMAVDPWC